MDYTIATNPPVTTEPLPPLMYMDMQTKPTETPSRKRPNKVHVSAACVNCKKAHLACDVSRPCNRCVTTDKADTCRDIQHKKRGRPKMMRDANNNKIRPPTTACTSSSSSSTTIPNRFMPTSSDFYPIAVSSNDMMIILLSMDLCCARVSDTSLDYLESYPQEFSHRSLYDFLLPGESQQALSKLHRSLLDNAVQHQQTKLPSQLIRSSSEQFFSSSLDNLLNIANGSLTLKHNLKFRRGRDANRSEEMHCRFYLGGGFGSDLFDASTLGQLYIVCVASPIVKSISISDVIHLPPLTINNNDSCSTVSSAASPTTTHITAEEEQLQHTSLPHQAQTQAPPQPPKYQEEQQGTTVAASTPFNPASPSNHFYCTTPTNTSSSTPPPPPTTTTANDEKSLLDKFRYNTKPPQQFIHPNELYYLKTTSSRLSSEAMAHTSYPYLSKTPTSAVGSGPLATYNNHFKN